MDFGATLSINLAASLSADFPRRKRGKAIAEKNKESEKFKTWIVTFFVTRNLPATCKQCVNISIKFYSRGAIDKLLQKLVHRVSSGFPNAPKK